MDLNNSKIAIIYVYYERKNETKNQSNLSFFIKYGLDLEKKRWANLNITTLFVIDKQTEVIIPNDESIFILHLCTFKMPTFTCATNNSLIFVFYLIFS
jgi:hypothetical protein